VYQVVIPRQLADRDLLKIFDSGEKVVLPPWDPMVRLSSIIYAKHKLTSGLTSMIHRAPLLDWIIIHARFGLPISLLLVSFEALVRPRSNF